MFSFDKIYGNEKIITNLQTAIKSKRISHAYIFSGQVGIGKKLISKSFAKTLQCEQGGVSPCNKCISCLTFESGNHPDIFYVFPSRTKALGVDDIREQIYRRMDVKPFKYHYKIFIVENADKMTTQAQNALLKTIEEPAYYGIFLLLAENIKSFLPTVLSRCVCLNIKPLDILTVERHLINELNVSKETASSYSMYSQGNIGRAVKLLNDDEFVNMRTHVLNIAENIIDYDIIRVFSIVKELENFKERIQEALDVLYLWYRDLAVFKETGSNNFLAQKDKTISIKKQASNNSLKALFEKLDAIWEAKTQLKYNGNFQLVMEVMLLKLKET